MTSVSVVIPTYNRCEFILQALASVAAQTRAPDEVIVIDDGSQDRTVQTVSERYPHVVIRSHPNRGVSASRNLGIKLASSTWIALLDSDDRWHPQKLEKQLQLAAREPDAELIHCDESWVRNGAPLNQKKYHRKSGGDIFAASLERCLISPSAAMIKRQLLLDVGLFDESLPACEDYDLWLRICANRQVAFVDEKLVTKYGGHADQLSKRVWGLDRFRIRALSNLVLGSPLSAEQTRLVNNVLQDKTRIFVQGAKKRGRFAEAQKLARLAAEIDQRCL